MAGVPLPLGSRTVIGPSYQLLTATEKSELCYDRRSVGQSVLVSSPHLWPKTRFLLVRQLRVFWCGAPSLTRGRVCRLQLLLVIGSAVILAGLMTVSNSRLPQPRGPGPRIYIPQEQGGPVITPGTGLRVAFSSPPTTRRATVEVFELASTRDWLTQVKVRVTLRLAAYHQSVHLGVKPLDTH
jgi:hypothetical protein